MPEEMYKLRSALDARKIEWINASDNTDRSFPFLNMIIYRTRWKYNGHEYSAISGFGTFGGDKGLLELMIDKGDPIGSLSACTILKMMDEVEDES